MLSRILTVPASVLLMSAMWGCGGGVAIPALGTVEGTITLDGSPLAGAVVEFVPDDGGRSSSAVTDKAGHYSLRYNAEAAGAVVGKHNVLVVGREGDGEDEGVVDEGPEIPDEYGDDLGEAESSGDLPLPVVPAKYGAGEEAASVLSFVVKAGTNQADFKLTSE